MRRNHSKPLLIAISLTVVLLCGAIASLGSACIGPIGCGLACTACGACTESCEHLFDDLLPDQPSLPPQTAAPTPEPMWDGPDSVQPTPTVEAESVEIPSAAPTLPGSVLDHQQPATVPGVREPRVTLRNDGTDRATVLILMNGSDLESEYQEATADITEMLRAQKTDRVNVVIETVGTRRWAPRYNVSADHAQRWLVQEDGLELLDNSLGQLDTTVPATLSDFIRWGAERFPAERYILILWDHGGGPVYGFGYDEYQPYSSTLTIDEMQIALQNGGVCFDLIGMDSCLMSSLEVCCALYEYCDYTLLSEDFEPGSGWSYAGWIEALNRDPAIDTKSLAKIAIDDTVRWCESQVDEDGVTLALMDQAYMKLLYTAWVEFAYANEDALVNVNYSQLRQSTGRAHPRLRSIGGWLMPESTLEDYCVTDILSVAQNIDSDESAALIAALKKAVVYFNATSDETTLTGLSVTLPYGDKAFYNDLKRVFRNAGFDTDYIAWLERFTDVKPSNADTFDFGGWGDLWNGWGATDSGFDWDDWFYDDETDGDPWANDDWFAWLFADD